MCVNAHTVTECFTFLCCLDNRSAVSVIAHIFYPHFQIAELDVIVIIKIVKTNMKC